jgi:hypothetical protein
VKRDLRPRPSLAHRFVEWYLAKIGQASLPVAKMRLLFVLVTASFLTHFLVIYGEFVFAEQEKKTLDHMSPEKHARISLNAKHLTQKDLEDLKALAQLPDLLKKAEEKAKEDEKKLKEEEEKLKKEEQQKPEPPKPEPKKEEPKKEEPKKEEPKKEEPKSIAKDEAKKDEQQERKVIRTEEQKKQTPVKNAPNSGGKTDHKVGVTAPAPDDKKAVEGLTKNPPKVDANPDPTKVADEPKKMNDTLVTQKTEPKKLEQPNKPVPIANIDGDAKAKESLNPNAEIRTKIKDPGKHPEPREAQTGIKPPQNVVARPAPPKPTPPPPPPAPLPPPPKPEPTPQQVQDAKDKETLALFEHNVPGGEEPPPPSGDDVKPPPPAPKPLPKVDPPKPQLTRNNSLGVGGAPPPPPKPAPQIPQPQPQPTPVVKAEIVPQPPVVKNDQKTGRPGPKTANTKNVPGNGRLDAPMPQDPTRQGTNAKTGPQVLADNKLKQRIVDRMISREQTDQQRDEVVDHNLHAMDDWIRYQLDGGQSPKGAIPGIFITNTSPDEWKDVVNHFDLCPMAFNDKLNNFVLLDIVRQTVEAKDQQGFNALKDRYASSGIGFPKRKLWQTDVFAQAVELACNSCRIPKNQANLMILVPKQVMSYMAWKSVKSIKDEGLDPAKVRTCHTRFCRTTDGWILKVTDFVLDDGSVRPVKT